ncbi:MAG: hypothetical protein HY22_12540 [[Candidatus Thermochlorobacteriaceae] bacterium GBChlB]|nr:MAG: hypothetical protein HY22_12540 [[Candidatus Thermochlorobacteriaceae] bacterium GBChlB]
MRIYLDTCSLQRPLDDKSQKTIADEAQSVIRMLALCERGEANLLSSEVLVFEKNLNRDLVRRRHTEECLKYATDFIELNADIEKRAEVFVQNGITDLDALHLASAEISEADYFCTSDKKFYKKATWMRLAKMKIVMPTELWEELKK